MAQSPVRRLDPVLVDRIAAGEVIERPAAAVKELVENAIDAGATAIEVVIEAGGRRLIRVTDNGRGMSPEDLALAVERHATSKLPDGDLFAIGTLGFRGEALPSIGAVARLSIVTRTHDAAQACAILVDGGAKGPVRPAAGATGTRVEIEGLFGATPARLKFLKSDRAEGLAVADIVRRLALAHPAIRFTLAGDTLSTIDLPAEGADEGGALRRAARIVGADFADDALPVDVMREGVRVHGFAGLPTAHRGTAAHVHWMVNGRPVRDKLLSGAVRGAYADVLPGDRHPVLVMSVDCDPREVDVNVHPAKSEVRFRDPGLVRGLVVSALRAAIAAAGHRATSQGGARTLDAIATRKPQEFVQRTLSGWQAPLQPLGLAEPATPYGSQYEQAAPLFPPASDAREVVASDGDDAPLGAARAQIHANYIVAQTRDGLVIVDQHAAHERIVYERLKAERAAHGIARQILLTPEIVELDPAEADRLVAAMPLLEAAGLVLEGFGPGAVAVREVPAALADGDIHALVRDALDALIDGADLPVDGRLDRVLSSIACHGSIRSGRRLKPEEMNALLRQMEVTPSAGQCNHGRPTYVELKLSDIERLFGRR